eukprot:IDg14424t1
MSRSSESIRRMTNHSNRSCAEIQAADCKYRDSSWHSVRTLTESTESTKYDEKYEQAYIPSSPPKNVPSAPHTGAADRAAYLTAASKEVARQLHANPHGQHRDRQKGINSIESQDRHESIPNSHFYFKSALQERLRTRHCNIFSLVTQQPYQHFEALAFHTAIEAVEQVAYSCIELIRGGSDGIAFHRTNKRFGKLPSLDAASK